MCRTSMASCLTCGEALRPEDRYCEACGAEGGMPSSPPAPISVEGMQDPPTAPTEGATCVRCGPPAGAGEEGLDAVDASGPSTLSAEGYCEDCGWPQPRPRDHVEIDLGVAAGVSDRGRRHHRNEDALALHVLGGDNGVPAVVAVVCDGVSSAERPDDASEAAARAGSAALVAALLDGMDPEPATREAMTSALAAVAGLAHAGERQAAPACTYVSAVVTAGTVTVGWVGDSRAYWVAASDPATPSSRLTVDDSWAAEIVASGVLGQAEAEAVPLAHAITAWLGADAGDVLPHVVQLTPEGPGIVVLCSDGLWNYLETAEMVAAALPAAAAEAPLAAARELVRVALQAGGHDNVTVAVLPFTGGRDA